MRRAQRTSFNALDNWGHKTPTQSKKRIKDRKERLRGHGPKHVYNTLSYTNIEALVINTYQENLYRIYSQVKFHSAYSQDPNI